MRKMLQKLTLVAILAFISGGLFAQGTVKGVLLDSETNETLVGATILQVGTNNGTTSDTEGAFSLSVEEGDHKIKISFVGYEPLVVDVSVSNGQTTDLGTFSVEPSAVSLEGLVIVGDGVIDIAKDRETPVAVSTIKVEEIQRKAGNQEFPEVMKNTPSVYVASQAGGYGDSRINIRGFEQENLALLFNGQPVNGMEDGRVYWSNWQGLSEVANAIQVQRGLGSSKLAISSVGATINVITKATDLEENGRVSAMFGNDAYMKYTASYSSGINEKGWGISLLLSHWQGDGYNDGTQGQGQTYFLSIGYKPSDKHAFNFSLTGAPQWHYQNFTKSLSAYDRDGDGSISNEEQKYNSNWGNLNGEVFTWRKNFYHKPVANLNWDWNISKKSKLSTVFYGSTGQGGGTGPYGRISDFDTETDDGQVDFDAIFASNRALDSSGEDFNIDGKRIGRFGTATFRRASMNMHRWWGTVINYNQDINDKLSFNLGSDLRTYYGEHYRQVDDLLGLDGYWDDNFRATGFQERYPGGVVYTNEHGSSPYQIWDNRNLEQETKLDYYNSERISYYGLFGQLEYKNELISTFVQGAVSSQSYQRFDYHTYSDPDEQVSEKKSFTGYNVKAGGNYNINEFHNVFVNAGYYSRQPFFDDLFLNFTNEVNEEVGNEGVLGLEVGYGYRSSTLSVDLNAYLTQWSDRQIRQSGDFDGDGESDDVALYENVGQNHSGVEIEFSYRPIKSLTISGFGQYGDWVYAGDVKARVFDENRVPIVGSANTLYLSGVKVGNAAQTSFGLQAEYQIIKGLSVDADYRYYDRLYASIDPEAFDSPDNKGSLQLPSFGLLDAGLTYNWYFNNKQAKQSYTPHQK
jgi:iron complex outermembrane receptor protein